MLGNLEQFIDKEITKDEALDLYNLKGSKLMQLFAVANKVREKYCGNQVHVCTITNAKSGKCSEDCKFCAQSSHYNTSVNIYGLKDKPVLEAEKKRAEEIGSQHFGIVTSGKAISKGSKDFDVLKEVLSENKKNIDICASIGQLSYEEAKELKEAGLVKFHSNLQTSIKKYSELVATTHLVEDRIKSIINAKKAGLKVCSGGIIGMGEDNKDRVDMAFSLKELDVDGIPLNILNPIKGTPHGDREILSVDEILKTIAIYRLILKDKTIKIAAGRESILKDYMGLAFMAGANGLLIGGYLTIKGRSVEEDNLFVKNLKNLWD